MPWSWMPRIFCSMTHNLHTHTFRCGHAVGTEREYIERALENGIKVLGFSDHMPFIFPDGRQSGFRVKADMAEDYIKTLTLLKEEYKQKIDIKTGFEMEYYPDHFKEMFSLAKALGAEYLILGEHFPSYEDGRFNYSGKATDDEAALYCYAKGCVDGIRSGAFTYVAHPDLFNFTGSDEAYDREMRKICVASRECNIPLEINFLGIRGKRPYPSKRFWQIASKEKCPVVFGFDAHDPKNAFDGESLKTATEMVKELGLKLITEPEIRNIQNLDF